ncbi:hypothetical protein [Hymenobacter sp. YC55]|uniref:hypothetical protein n=1 Tax=Hymenobacter sp. YC55 TaxID=3034019 RepID=UPI0023F710AF|nr:hypothetical protein [Hymenobacter sp. YC55]MDF7812016.1 hypothetical protein [Hymenobacter sp. YC55]
MRWLAFVLVVSLVCGCLQASAQIKVEEVEVWGLPVGMSAQNLVDALNRNKQTVCEAAIRPMGFKEANVFGMDHISLVTLRSAESQPCEKGSTPNVAISHQLNNTFMIKQLHTAEFQQALTSLYANQANDSAAVRAIQKRFVRTTTSIYQAMLRKLQTPNQLTIPQCMAVLCSTAADTVREKALVQIATKLRVEADAHQLVPFMQDPLIGTWAMQAVRGYFKYHSVPPTNWAKVLPAYIQALNAPNPTVTTMLAIMLAQHQIPRQLAPRILTNGAVTMHEILHGKHPELVVFKQQLYPLLSYLSATEIRDETAALAYLSQFQKK